MEIITVNASHTYDIIIGRDILKQSGEIISKLNNGKKAAIVTDDIVDALYSNEVEKSLKKSGYETVKFVFKNGEKQKSHKTLLSLYEFLCENDITRTDVIVALGGGVVGDLTGFAAATYLRGVDYVQIPTTLLAMVDSSVGGKTAVDIPSGKNLVGAFNQPITVIGDINTLSSLSDEIFTDGMGEVIKYGMICSESLFEKLCLGNARTNPDEIISECIKIKRDVVQHDEYDTGERMILNFGHTLGHAIEKYYNFNGISHGKGVAVGMAMLTLIAVKNGTVSADVYERLEKCLKINKLPSAVDIPIDKLACLCRNDKKRTSSSIRIVLCPSIGKSDIVTMSNDEFTEFLLK